MSLGVLTNIAAIYAENNLNQTQASLQNTLTQLSSGSRINSGADDAAGLSVVNGLQANVTALTQSAQNASDGIGLLQTADGALSQVTNLLNRAVTLATEAANGTLNSNQVSSANAEYQNILQEIGDIGSTTNFNGNSVFTASAKTVFVSDGTANGANSYSEIVGGLTQGSVGETVGATILSLPTPTTPTATTTVQSVSSLSASSVTTNSVNPTPVAAAATASATGTLTTAVTGSNAFSGTDIIASGTQASTGGAAYTPSTLTAVPASSFTPGTDTYGGVIGVRLVTSTGSSSLYTATVAAGSSLQTLVTALNNSFGYNPGAGTTSTSGLQASIGTNGGLQITTGPTPTGQTVGQVSIDAPTNSLQVKYAGAGNAASFAFSGTGGVTTTTSTVGASGTAATATFALGTGVVQGNLIISSSGGAALGTIAFGSGSTASATPAAVESALATAFGATGVNNSGTVSYTGTGGLAGYSASYNSSTGSLVITGNQTTDANFEVTTGTSTAQLEAGSFAAPLVSGGASNGAIPTAFDAASTAANGVTVALGTTAVSGNLVVATQAGVSAGTISFGTAGTTVGQTAIESALASAFGSGTTNAGVITYSGGGTLNGYTAAYTVATGSLNINDAGGTGASVYTTNTNGLEVATPATVTATGSGLGSVVSTAAQTTTSGALAAPLILGASSPSTSDTYNGTLTLQLANSAQTYTVNLGSTPLSGAAAVNAINEVLGSSIGGTDATVGSIGASGLAADLNANGQIQIYAAGSQLAVVDNASNLIVNPGGVTASATGSSVISGGTTTSTGYTAVTSATASTSGTATVAIGTAAVEGTLNIYAGSTGQGPVLGAINFGTDGVSSSVGGAGGSVLSAIANTFTGAVTNPTSSTVTYAGTGTLAGYSATYNTGTGALTITGPSSGTSFSLGQATSGTSQLETGTVSTTLEAGTGVTAATAFYSGTLGFGGQSFVISSPETAAQIASNTTFQADLAAANLAATATGGQLVFTNTLNTATAPPAVTVTNGVSTNQTLSASSVTFAPTSGTGSSATFTGNFSINYNGHTYATSTPFSNTSSSAVLTQLTSLLSGSGLTAAQNATTGAITITGATPTAVTSDNGATSVANSQITVNQANNLSGAAASTQTLTNANAAAGTTYTGTISWGAVGTTSAGSYVIGSNSAATTATAIASAINTQLGNSASGITASVNSSNELVFTGPSTGSGITLSPGITLTNVTSQAPAVTSYTASTAAFAANTGGTFSGVLTVGTTSTGQISSTVAAGTTLANLVTQLNNQYTEAGVSSQLIASAGTGSQAGQLIISSAVPTTATQATNDTLVFSQASGANTLLATSATSTNGGPGSGVDFTSSSIDQLTASTAQNVLTAVTSAINDVAYQRGLVGADVNELTAASNVASAESVNLTSAQATVQQTDYGATTSNLAKYQVLSQTGISALAQANSVQQEVLKLLQ